MLFRFNDKRRRRVAGAMIAFFLFFQVVGVFFVAKPVYAFPVEVLEDIPQKLEELFDQILQATVASLLGGVMQAATYMFRKVAYDAAVYVASGGKGQGALVFQEGFGKYLENTALDAAADGISALGQPFGLSLCGYPDVNLRLFVQIGLRELYGAGPPTPNCSWQQLDKGFSKAAFEEKYGPGFSKLVPEKFSDIVSVKNSDFGVAIGALGKVDGLTLGALEANKLTRIVNKGFKDVTDAISGEVRTPASFVEEEVSQVTSKHQGEITAGQLAGIYGANYWQVIPMAASVFVNTLTSQLLNKVIKGLFPTNLERLAGGDLGDFFGLANNRRQAAQAAFSELLTTVIPPVNVYDIVAEYVSCPPNPGLNNCVMDTDFQQILIRAQADNKPLTIQEALNLGLLHGERPIISPRRVGDNANPDPSFCQTQAYCYSNIQKLRKARMLPLGFEVAAFKADPDNPPSLKQVVDGFYQCDSGGRPSQQFPYCHLINPNWVIKAPQAVCQTKVRGPLLLGAQVPERREECADLATCLRQNERGQCESYGFCTKEKNVWKFVGVDTCEAQYATCQQYTDTERRSVYYLSRSLDFGQCDAGSVGCRAYSAEQVTVRGQDRWVASVNANPALKTISLGRNQVVYLNQTITGQSCSPTDEGCTAVYPSKKSEKGDYLLDTTVGRASFYVQDTDPQSLLHVKKAPDYLECYDTDLTTRAIEWPSTIAQAANLRVDRCTQFARACAPQEVGCDAFAVVNDPDAPSIPGIIGGGRCAEICVGYDTFKQVASTFELERFPLYFVPTQGQQCDSTYVGCSEFTNLDAATRGGENKEYYTYIKYCERPAANNEKTFYSWVGSAREGYTLQVHRLLQVTSTVRDYIVAANPTLRSKANSTVTANPGDIFALGSPAYADTRPSELTGFYRNCNADDYTYSLNNPDDLVRGVSPDCRALFDDEGNIYHRLLKQTVTVSEQCHRSRQTESSLAVDPVLTSDGECRRYGGLWGPVEAGGVAQCQRCVGGGRYDNGACVFNVLTSESNVCPAPANGCREYVGNAGNRPRIVFDDRFEIGSATNTAQGLLLARANWQGQPVDDVRVAAESIRVGEQSLYVGPNAATLERVIAPRVEPIAGTTTTRIVPILTRGDAYELNFWARGGGESVEITWLQNNQVIGIFTLDPVTNNTIAATIGNSWREYRFGPVVFTGDGSVTTTLRFTRRSAPGARREFFIDNVRLLSNNNHLFLRKNSWQRTVSYNNRQVTASAPLACDSNPTDPFPGEALGCRLYQDTKGRRQAAANFEQLCRLEAVGCEPVYDTKNTLSGDNAELAHVYNLWCTGPSGSRCNLAIGGQSVGICDVPIGATGCFSSSTISLLPTVTTLPAGSVVTSTIIIPADTPSTTPIYLTTRPEFLCQPNNKGCQRLGLEEQILPQATTSAFTHRDVYLKNDPDRYVGTGAEGGTLCRQEVIGCGQFRADNQVVYFKDPRVTGQAVCTYRPDVVLNGTTVSGWFIDGVGECSQNANQLCRTNAECGAGNTCVPSTIGSVPCYRDFVRRDANQGLVYDLRSSNTSSYRGFVGSCPAAANQCVELLDPADTSNVNPNGKPYYVVYNNKMKERAAQCEGVSLTEGCVLFNRTDQPRKLYNSRLSYQASAQDQFRIVSPIVDRVAANNDSNLILKVDRDRECSEWLACKTSVIVKQKDGRSRSVCSEYRACNAARGGKCTNWIDRNELSIGSFTEQQYINRSISWYDVEYSGYTMFNRKQIHDLAYVLFDLSAYEDTARNILFDDLERASYAVYYRDAVNRDCQDVTASDTNWRQCGPEQGGRCYAGRCLYPVEGLISPNIAATSTDGSHIRQIFGALTGGTCKGYPESNSPYPTKVVDPKASDNAAKDNSSLNPLIKRSDFPIRDYEEFERANICQDGNCSCAYEKYEYKNGTVDYWDYYKTDKTRIPRGVCSGNGDTDGLPCDADTQCARNGQLGVCNKVKRKSQLLGLLGHCVEPDLSRPINGAPRSSTSTQDFACLSWIPVEVSAGKADLFNSYQEAGYYPVDRFDGRGQNFGQLYCTTIDRGGWQDLTAFGRTVAITVQQSIYDRIFNNIPSPLPAEQTQECQGVSGIGFRRTDLVNNPGAITYYKLVCAGSPLSGAGARTPNAFQREVSDLLYQSMQVFGWRWFGNNALVMRAEADTTRNFNNGPLPLNQATTLIGSRGVFRDGTAFRTNETYISPHINGGQAFTYDRDIDSVYIVPLAYMSGGNGLIPNILTTELSVPVTALKRGYEQRQTYFKIGPTPISFYYGDRRESNGIFSTLPLRDYAFGGEEYPGAPSGFNAGGEHYARNSFGDDFASIGRINKTAYVMKRQQYPNLFDAQDGNPTSDPNNAVEWRYVLVFSNQQVPLGTVRWGNRTDIILGWNPTPSAVATNNYERPATDPNDDPILTTNCDAGEFDNSGDIDASMVNENWFAVALNFNRDGRFLGYRTNGCLQSNLGGSERFPMYASSAVIATLRNQCLEVNSVYDDSDDPLVNGSNKAWTQRVWQSAAEISPTQTIRPRRSAVHTRQNAQGIISVESVQPPYAAVSAGSGAGPLLRGLDDTSIPNPTPQGLLDFAFESPTIDGAPYSCTDSFEDSASSNINDWIRRCPLPTRNLNGQLITDGYRQPGAETNLVDLLSRTGPDTARQALSELFARVYIRARFTPDRTRYTVSARNIDVSRGARAAELDDWPLQPPQIYSLNPVTCAETEAGFASPTCTAGEPNNITINQRNGTIANYDNDGANAPDEDRDGDGFSDPLIDIARFSATVRFFAFADDNRMPLRRVMVDWGDGSDPSNVNKRGFYKNRKPFCSADNGVNITVGVCVDSGVQTSITCQTNANCPLNAAGRRMPCAKDGANDTTTHVAYRYSRFGNAPRSCDTDPYEFHHDFTCSREDVEAFAIARNAGQARSARRPWVYEVRELRNQGTPAYNPDAYERLTGQFGMADNDAICVFRPIAQVLDNWGWCNGVCSGGECYNDQGRQACNITTSGRYPGTQYAGQIFVVPPGQ